MKHPQHIVAIPADLVSNRVNGWSVTDIKGTDLIIGCRHHLEDNEAYRQVIPVTVLVKGKSIWCYYRGNSGGEARLYGKLACALGGHWDLKDLSVNSDSVIDYDNSINNAALRELSEEITITGEVMRAHAYKKLLAVDDTPVDRVHVAVITFFFMSEDSTVTPKEDDLIEEGWIDINECAINYDNRETWTDYIFDALDELHVSDLINEGKIKNV